MAFDRFLKPRILGGPRRRGVPRAKWTSEVLAFALSRMSGHVLFREYYEETRREHRALVELAQDRGKWKRVAQWASRSVAPEGFYLRVEQPSRAYQAAV
eukprot:15474203-Alexandrium_andersonii.AAC.1